VGQQIECPGIEFFQTGNDFIADPPGGVQGSGLQQVVGKDHLSNGFPVVYYRKQRGQGDRFNAEQTARGKGHAVSFGIQAEPGFRFLHISFIDNQRSSSKSAISKSIRGDGSNPGARQRQIRTPAEKPARIHSEIS
jgi:hypothetical protein